MQTATPTLTQACPTCGTDPGISGPCRSTARMKAHAMTQTERAARINALRVERDAVRADRDHAYARCDTMAACGDMRGWQDWLGEALRLADKLDRLTEESDALAALCL